MYDTLNNFNESFNKKFLKIIYHIVLKRGQYNRFYFLAAIQ